MEAEIRYAKYPFPAVDMGNYEYEEGDPMYEEGDRAYCNGILPDGRPFVAEHYFSKEEQKDYLITVFSASDMMGIEDHDFNITKQERRDICSRQCFQSVILMEMDDIDGDLLNTEYQEEVTKYLLQQGVITDGYARCDCMYLTADNHDNFTIVACYEMPELKGCGLKMQGYREDID